MYLLAYSVIALIPDHLNNLPYFSKSCYCFSSYIMRSHISNDMLKALLGWLKKLPSDLEKCDFFFVVLIIAFASLNTVS